MEHLNTNDLIEQYLSGSLSPAGQQAVEVRIATDAEFREAVALQRQLQEEFADAKKLELRKMLQEIVREPPPAKFGWLKGLGIILAFLLTIGLFYYWRTLPRPAPPLQEQIKAPSQVQEPVATPKAGDPPVELTKKIPEQPIAKANPAAFVPNRQFEDRLGSNLRASTGTAEMNSPVNGADFTPANGFVKINFSGAVPADADISQYPLVLKIYDNQAVSGKALFQTLPEITNRNMAKKEWTFSIDRPFRLPPGLYYFTLERQADEDLVFVGKFTVGAR